MSCGVDGTWEAGEQIVRTVLRVIKQAHVGRLGMRVQAEKIKNVKRSMFTWGSLVRELALL